MELKNPIFFETPRLRKFYEHNFGLLTDSQTTKKVQDLISSANKTTIDKDLFSQMLEDSSEKENKHMGSHMGTRYQERKDSDNKQYKDILNTVHHQQRINHNTQQGQQVQLSLQTCQSQQQSQSYSRVINAQMATCSPNNQSLSNVKGVMDIPTKTSTLKKDKQIKKRKRKSNLQIQLLQQEFISEIEWTKDKISEVSLSTNLSESQVYKWCWDQKKKQNQEFQKDEQHIIDWHNRQKMSQSKKSIKKTVDHQVTKKLLFN